MGPGADRGTRRAGPDRSRVGWTHAPLPTAASTQDTWSGAGVNALRALGAAEDAVTPAAGMQAMAVGRARVASAVAAAQATRPMPVAAPKQNYARALRHGR